MKKLTALLLAIIFLAGIGTINAYAENSATPAGNACTMEVKMCPDGSSVSRTGPNCKFTACPGISTGTDSEISKDYNGLRAQIEKLLNMVKGLQSQKEAVKSKVVEIRDKKNEVINPATRWSPIAVAPKPGKMHLSIQELGNGRNEVNIKNAVVTEIGTPAIVCVTAPCNQPINLKIKVLGLTFDVKANTTVDLLSENRGKVVIDSFAVGDYVNVYGTQDQNSSSVINAQIIRNVSLTNKIIRNRAEVIRNNPEEKFCAQVETKAKNPQTGEVKVFPTPCAVPQGWTIIMEISGSADSSTATATPADTNSTTTNSTTTPTSTSTTQ